MSAESHALSVSIEWDLRHLFNCDRFGLGGLVNSDSIERDPYNSFVCGLAAVYCNASTIKREQIDNFIENICQYEDKTIDEIGISIVENLQRQFKNLL